MALIPANATLVEKKKVPPRLMGEGGACSMLCPQGEKGVFFGCMAKGFEVNCPLGAMKEVAAGSQCTNYSLGKPNGQAPKDLGKGSLIKLKESEPPGKPSGQIAFDTRDPGFHC